jgi:hypothetical protein
LVAWLVLAVVAVIALKVLLGIVAGFVQSLLFLVVLAVLVLAAVWALRRV